MAIVKKRQVVGSTTLSVGYTYDLADHLVATDYPGTGAATYTRDTMGRLTGLSVTPLGGSAQGVLQDIDYAPFGPPNGYVFQTGQTLTKAYDHNYWATDVAGTALDLHFQRNSVGNIAKLTDNIGAALEQYGYDSLYRLTSVGDATGTNIESYAYDATGDRQSKTVGLQTPQAYVYDATSHHLTSVNGTARTYDNAGNTETDGTGSTARVYTYDDRNRLVSANMTGSGVQVTFQYNARGERISKTSNNTTTLYLYDEAGMLLGEYTGTGTPQRAYIYADAVPVALIDTSGNLDYIHTDQLGTPRAVTSSAGTVIWTWAFEGNPFGEAASVNDPDGNGVSLIQPLRFPGQYFDSEIALNYNSFRNYDSYTGRYMESDPIRDIYISLSGKARAKGVGSSSYIYASGNPLKNVDPLGLLDDTNKRPDPWDDPDSCPLVDVEALIRPWTITGPLSAWLCIYDCNESCPGIPEKIIIRIEWTLFPSMGCDHAIKRPPGI